MRGRRSRWVEGILAPAFLKFLVPGLELRLDRSSRLVQWTWRRVGGGRGLILRIERLCRRLRFLFLLLVGFCSGFFLFVGLLMLPLRCRSGLWLCTSFGALCSQRTGLSCLVRRLGGAGGHCCGCGMCGWRWR